MSNHPYFYELLAREKMQEAQREAAKERLIASLEGQRPNRTLQGGTVLAALALAVAINLAV